jgi:hypothetical protein
MQLTPFYEPAELPDEATHFLTKRNCRIQQIAFQLDAIRFGNHQKPSGTIL